MSNGQVRESYAADQVRRRLAWLSAQEAGVRLMGYTRSLTADEQAQLAAMDAESAALRRTLDRLNGQAVAPARGPAPPKARSKQLVAA